MSTTHAESGLRQGADVLQTIGVLLIVFWVVGSLSGFTLGYLHYALSSGSALAFLASVVVQRRAMAP